MKRIYKNCILLDGTKDMEAIKTDVVVENGIITEISENYQGEGEVLDLNGKYLMPGLINLHVHLPAGGKPEKKIKDKSGLVKFLTSNPITRKIGVKICADFAKTELLSGVTTIRTVGGIADFDTILRDKINSGKILGPRILASNMAIGPVNGHMVGTVTVACSTFEECEQMIDKLKAEGVDWIKIMITGGVLDAKVKGEPGIVKMGASFIKCCTEKAHSLGLKVCAHVESFDGVKLALQNGVDSIEHGSALDEEMIDIFKKRNDCYVCTISPALPLAKFDPSITGATEMVVYNSNIVLEGVIDGAKTALENGITVGMGTDTGCPYITHYNMWRELHYFSKYLGVSKKFALHTATLVNASILGLEKEIGSVEVGKCADLLITDANPLDDFRTLAQPYMVVAKGHEIIQPKIKKFAECDDNLDKYM